MQPDEAILEINGCKRCKRIVFRNIFYKSFGLI